MQGKGAPLEPGMVAVPRDLLVRIVRDDLERLEHLGQVVVALPDWETANDQVLLQLIEILREAHQKLSQTIGITAD